MASNTSATQEFVPIKEVRDGIVILKDGGMRSILLCSSLNFSLKSEDERNAILLQFQDFLNSLDFSIEIVIQSRKLDIRPYIALLETQEANQTNNLMKIQVREYIEFIKNFTENTNIMTKSFFIVVPYSPAIINPEGSKSIESIGARFGLGNKKNESATLESNFDENRTQLEERLSVVEQGLVRTGIRVAHLGTEEVLNSSTKHLIQGKQKNL